jgi:hypothetical protein
MDATMALVYAFVTSRLDYCNSILISGVTAVHLRQLQSVLNAAARLVVQERKYDHVITTSRDDLHWLPITQRIDYKTGPHRQQVSASAPAS